MTDQNTSDLPFFAYGMFREGEIAYPRVRPFIESVTPGSIRGRLEERDGVYLLVLEGGRQVDGDILHFRAGEGRRAYEAIEALEPRRTYRWHACGVQTGAGQLNARVLVARSPGRGSHPVELPYRSRDDPLFAEGMDEVEYVLSPEARPKGFVGQFNAFFQYQMAYLLLWSAIERYCTLRYGFGRDPMDAIHQLAEEPAFAEALKERVAESRRVFRADRPTDGAERLDPEHPEASIDYYYQVRSNIVHRGKSVYEELDLVRDSLAELSAIFRDVLDSTLGPRG